jgi:ATP-dependent Clp protease ATP-binding subunit ClpA
MVSGLKTNGAVSSDLMAHLNGLRLRLATCIKGQDHVLDRVCSVLTRGELGMAHPRRPKGSFLFVGPTGVGKTELTNVFTKYLLETKPIRFDMSEYQLQKSVDKLIGESAADSGLLGRALRGRTRGTLLFDEIEKGHTLVLDLFLQMLEDGRITLATGEVIDLRGFYIVGTSNIGSAETTRMESAPFASVERTVLMRVREQFRPELVGRFSEMIVFGRLDYSTQRTICETMIAAELGRLGRLGHRLEAVPDVLEFLVRAGYHRLLGARPMRGAVERFIQDALAENLLQGGTGQGALTTDPVHARLLLKSESGRASGAMELGK